MFPIFDARGEPVGFGGRALDDERPEVQELARDADLPEEPAALRANWAKGEIVARGEVVICEGYTDVMAFALAGVPNAVATCGTALADDHFQILKNLARKVDARLRRRRRRPGRGRAVVRSGSSATRSSSRSPTSPPVAIPPTCGATIPSALVEAVEAAPRRSCEFRLDRLLAAADLATLEGRARAARGRAPRSSPSTRASSCATST